MFHFIENLKFVLKPSYSWIPLRLQNCSLALLKILVIRFRLYALGYFLVYAKLLHNCGDVWEAFFIVL